MGMTPMTMAPSVLRHAAANHCQTHIIQTQNYKNSRRSK